MKEETLVTIASIVNVTGPVLGLVAALTTACVMLGSKEPFQMNGVDYRGYKNDKESGVQLLYFGNRKEGIVNEAKTFDVDKAYHLGGDYNVAGYNQWGNAYATKIIPVKAESTIKVEAD
jgi:hypothetical protein